MTERQDDRRKARRVDANLNLEVKVPRSDGSLLTASLETINISSSGVYFKSDHFIDPMTKLAMELEVSVRMSPDGLTVEKAPVPCEGLVVRVSPETETPDCESYEIAVFFTHIEPEGMANLERHISLLIEQMGQEA